MDEPAKEKRRFSPNNFGDAMIQRNHMVYIDGAPAIWSREDRRYYLGRDAVYRQMILNWHAIRSSQRAEVMSYLTLCAPRQTMADSRYIAFANGVLDITDMTLRPNTPDYLIPNVIPHNWNPDAHSGALEEALGAWACKDSNCRQNLLEIVGLCLYRGREMACCPLLIGKGANGKSTYLNLLRRVIGEDNTSAMDLRTIGARFQSVELMGKLANIGDDISNDFVAGSRLAIVKKVISGDWIAAEYKGGATFKYQPYCTLIFSLNSMPSLGDASEGMMRRLVPVPFNANFARSSADRSMATLLGTVEVAESLIRLGVDALRQCIARGGMTDLDGRNEMLNEIREQNSSVYAFFQDELLGEVEQIIGEPTGAMYERYKDYCSRVGITRFDAASHNQFSRSICELFRVTIKRKRIDYLGETKQARVFVRM